MWWRKPDEVLVVQPKQFRTPEEVMAALELMCDMIMSCKLDIVEVRDTKGSITVKGRPRRVERFHQTFDRLHAKGLI